MIRKVKANIIQYRGLCCDKINTSVTSSSADAGKPARRDIIRREQKYRQLVGRRTAVPYAEGVLTYRQAAASYSTAIAQRYQTENF